MSVSLVGYEMAYPRVNFSGKLHNWTQRLPPGIQAGDYLMMVVYTEKATVSTPPGWVPVLEVPFLMQGGTSRAYVFVRWGDGDTPNPDLSATTEGQHSSAALAFRGVDQDSSAIYDMAHMLDERTYGMSQHDTPELTHAPAGSLIVRVAGPGVQTLDYGGTRWEVEAQYSLYNSGFLFDLEEHTPGPVESVRYEAEYEHGGAATVAITMAINPRFGLRTAGSGSHTPIYLSGREVNVEPPRHGPKPIAVNKVFPQSVGDWYELHSWRPWPGVSRPFVIQGRWSDTELVIPEDMTVNLTAQFNADDTVYPAAARVLRNNVVLASGSLTRITVDNLSLRAGDVITVEARGTDIPVQIWPDGTYLRLDPV